MNVDEKSLAKLQKWLDKQGEDVTFKAVKMRRHREGQSSQIQVGETYYGEAAFSQHPYTKEKCMTFGRGLEGRMWTSPVLSAKKKPFKNIWLIKTYNSFYQLEIYKK